MDNEPESIEIPMRDWNNMKVRYAEIISEHLETLKENQELKKKLEQIRTKLREIIDNE